MATPDGGSFGGKGFRSTWQEGVVAVATALHRQPDAPRDAIPGKGYDGDLVAPMIRDIGLGLAMGDTPLDVMAANLGKAGFKSKRWLGRRRRSRFARWCLARRGLTTHCSSSDCKRNHDRTCLRCLAPEP